ncbi:MAG: MOSC domain-containing protein [Aestuariivirga sp.]
MKVVSVSRSARHHFSKELCDSIFLVEGLGVDGDCHFGKTVQHLSRVAVDPTQPNLRQVHLIQAELLDELGLIGFKVSFGELGENIITHGIDLLSLPRGSLLKIGERAVVEITGLRNPCQQIELFQQGLLSKMVFKSQDGAIVRKSGIMAVVKISGSVAPGDQVVVELPSLPHTPLERV